MNDLRTRVIRFACTLLLALLAATAGAAERDAALDATLRAFVDAWNEHDLRAFDAIADDPPARGEAWRWVRATVTDRGCLEVHGARWTIEENDGKCAHGVVDIDATLGGAPMATPWTVGLVHGARGWRVTVATITAREMATSFLNGGHEWWQTCEDEEIVPPKVLAYHLADEVSRPAEGWTARNEEGLQKATNIALSLGDRELLAFCYAFRTRLAFNQHHYDEAAKWGEAGVAEATAAGSVDALTAARLFLGLAEWRRDHLAAALAQMEQAAATIDRIDNRRIALTAMINLVYLHFASRDYRGALVAAKQTLAASRQYQWNEGELIALGSLAGLHEEVYDFRAARRYWLELLDKERKAGLTERYEGITLGSLAITELALGDVAAATRHFAKATELAKDTFRVIEAKTWYALALLRGGRTAEADRALREAIEAGYKIHEGHLTAVALARLSAIRVQQHRHREAIALAREAVEQQNLPGVLSVESAPATAHLAMGRALAAAGRNREAIEELRASIEATESERRALPDEATVRFYQDNAEPYHELAEVLVRGGRPFDALQVAERMRSRTLIDSLRHDSGSALQLTPAEERRRQRLEQKLEDLNRELVAGRDVQKQLDAARADVDRFTDEMALLHGGRGIAIEPMQRSLPAAFRDTVVLEYVVTERSTIVFTVRRKGDALDVRAHVLPLPRARLAKLVARFTTRIIHRDADYAEDAASLYRALVAPVEPELEGASLIAIVPDMELWTLPFHALRRPSGRYLIEDAGVFYAPSLTALQIAARNARHRTQPPSLLAFGNPVPGDAAAAELRAAGRGSLLGALPDAEREVRSIALLYGAQHSRVYLRQDAKESVFKERAPHYDVLHLATHGLLDDNAPMYSALLLAASDSDRGDDGLLETREVVHMRLNAGLAVLAACDTARGSLTPGEGVVGLSWAFLMAGCPTTVVSQWATSSAPTSRLMIDFHTALTGGRTKAEALRTAELAMLHDPRYRHPFYWAPFILLGMPF